MIRNNKTYEREAQQYLDCVVKPQILARDNFKCKICGTNIQEHYNKYKSRLQIHHIDKNHYNNEFSNLITLCIKCHNRITLKDTYKNKIFTQETRNKLSKARLGMKFSEETKKNISNGLKELYKDKTKHPHYGKKRSEETKNKISKSNTGKIRTKEMINNMSKAHLGKNLSDEHKNNIRKSMKGNKKLSNSLKKFWDEKKKNGR